jgi:hypothetical protein
MRATWYVFGIAAALALSANSNAAYMVTTNMNGADAEVREDSGDVNINTNPVWGPIGAPQGVNRGTNTELATRALDTTIPPPPLTPAGNNTSAMYLKFDISDANGVTNTLLGLSNRVKLQMTTRNSAQQRWNRVHAPRPYYGSLPADDTNPEFVAFRSDPANYERVKFNVFGLTNFAHPRYDWSESGVAATWNPATSPTYGPEGSITWYNAPGITPDSRLTGAQDQGKYNFNSDLTLLGKAILEDPGLPSAIPPPYPNIRGTGSAAHCVGCISFDFEDTDGNLHQLIEDARAAGQTHITLVVAFGLDTFRNSNFADPDGMGPEPDPPAETSQTTPNDMLAFNYLFNPKEMDANTTLAGRQLNTDPSYNADWTDVLPAVDPDGPGPLVSGDGVADNGLTGPGPYSAANNDNGRFSPKLVFFVPEPSSFVLMVVGSLAAMATSRRRKS